MKEILAGSLAIQLRSLLVLPRLVQQGVNSYGSYTLREAGLLLGIPVKYMVMVTAFPFTVLVVFLAMANAQHNSTPNVPEGIKAPAGEELVLQVHAVGSQIYVCQAAADQKLSWVLKAPEAELTDPSGKAIGTHFAGPSWKHQDGSEVKGKLVSRVDAPEPEAIPWLLLAAAGHSGNGVLSQVTSIQRIQTHGGQAPKTGCDQAHSGAEVKIPYSADYYFYAPAR